MENNLTDKNIEQYLDKLGRKQFRKQKKTWTKGKLNQQALTLIYGGTKSDVGDAFAKWNKV